MSDTSIIFYWSAVGITCFVAWLTHIFTSFAQGTWGFLIAGAIFPPIGVLHGFYIWFT